MYICTKQIKLSNILFQKYKNTSFSTKTNSEIRPHFCATIPWVEKQQQCWSYLLCFYVLSSLFWPKKVLVNQKVNATEFFAKDFSVRSVYTVVMAWRLHFYCIPYQLEIKNIRKTGCIILSFMWIKKSLFLWNTANNPSH